MLPDHHYDIAGMIPSIEVRNACLERYDEALSLKNSKSLPNLDKWYRIELRDEVNKRSKSKSGPYITLDELVNLVGWKTTVRIECNFIKKNF
jgi:hypothetical protein